MFQPIHQAGPTGIAFSLPCALVVNDRPDRLETLHHTLDKLGVVEIHTTSNGCDALRKLARLEAAPELIICNMLMPDMDGIELIGQLNQRRYRGALILLCEGASQGLIDIARHLVDAGRMQLLGTYLRPPTEHDLAEVLSIHAGVRHAVLQRASRFGELRA